MAFDLRLDGGLLRIRLYDTLAPRDLHELADAVLDLEARVRPVPGRVTDMTGITTVAVGFAEFLMFAERRRTSELPNAIRSALVVATDVQLGVARMFQTLNDHPEVTVAIFRDLHEAAAWAAAAPAA